MPAAGAAIVCSIFIASRISSGAPFATASPALTITRRPSPTSAPSGVRRAPPLRPRARAGRRGAGGAARRRRRRGAPRPAATTVGGEFGAVEQRSRSVAPSAVDVAATVASAEGSVDAPVAVAAHAQRSCCRRRRRTGTRAHGASLPSHHGSTSCHGECGSPDARAAPRRPRAGAPVRPAPRPPARARMAPRRRKQRGVMALDQSGVEVAPSRTPRARRCAAGSATLVVTPTISILGERRASCGAAPRRGPRPRRSAWRSSDRSTARSRRPRARRCRRARRAEVAGARRCAMRADRRQEAALGILGVDAAPRSRGRGSRGRSCAQRQRLAGGDAQLPFDQVEAGDHLGDRMLDLQPRVHLHEVERASPCGRR